MLYRKCLCRIPLEKNTLAVPRSSSCPKRPKLLGRGRRQHWISGAYLFSISKHVGLKQKEERKTIKKRKEKEGRKKKRTEKKQRKSEKKQDIASCVVSWSLPSHRSLTLWRSSGWPTTRSARKRRGRSRPRDWEEKPKRLISDCLGDCLV